MTIGSLFSGIGGLELGLEWAGLGPTLWQVEQNEFCCKVLEKHWPDATRHRGVREVGAANLQPVGVICGGFPCQDISLAGAGAGLSGARSGLWFEYARIVGELRPRIVVVENVSALLGRGLGDVLGCLASLGYDAWWDCIPAAAVGAPHRRDRLFVVGWLADNDGAGRPRALPDTRRHDEQPNFGDNARGGCEDGTLADAGRRELQRLGGPAVVPGEPGTTEGRGQERQRLRDAACDGGEIELAYASRQAQPRLGREPDGLSARLDRWPARPGEAQHDWEAPRVCGKCDNRAARLKALGNAVVPQVGYVVGQVVRRIMETA